MDNRAVLFLVLAALLLVAALFVQSYSQLEDIPSTLSAYKYTISTRNGYTWAEHRNGTLAWNLTDAYTVIENAINDTFNAEISLTAGAYNLSHGLKLHYNVGLKGEGITRTNLYLNNYVNESMITYAATSNVACFIHLSDFFMQGNGLLQSAGHGINFYNNGGIVMDAIIERVWISSAKQDGFHLSSTWGTKLTDCLAEFNGGNGVYWYNPTQEYLTNIFSEANGAKGLHFQGGTGVMGLNIQSLFNPVNIQFTGLSDSMFTNVRSTDNNGTISVYFYGATRIQINNLVEIGTNTTVAGVYFATYSGTVCTNNTITNAIIHGNDETWGRGVMVESGQLNTRFIGASIYDNNYRNVDDSGTNTLIEW